MPTISYISRCAGEVRAGFGIYLKGEPKSEKNEKVERRKKQSRDRRVVVSDDRNFPYFSLFIPTSSCLLGQGMNSGREADWISLIIVDSASW